MTSTRREDEEDEMGARDEPLGVFLRIFTRDRISLARRQPAFHQSPFLSASASAWLPVVVLHVE